MDICIGTVMFVIETLDAKICCPLGIIGPTFLDEFVACSATRAGSARPWPSSSFRFSSCLIDANEIMVLRYAYCPRQASPGVNFGLLSQLTALIRSDSMISFMRGVEANHLDSVKDVTAALIASFFFDIPSTSGTVSYCFLALHEFVILSMPSSIFFLHSNLEAASCLVHCRNRCLQHLVRTMS
ncbi:hypothetical protein V6N12_019056 [Hibiscus sabdariffa]|uniref:Uncharacterized protein n=1 Tax=Hibiscus sabdariffa TaxID=183260 RepID=A0ABR2B9V3_9ROSI